MIERCVRSFSRPISLLSRFDIDVTPVLTLTLLCVADKDIVLIKANSYFHSYSCISDRQSWFSCYSCDWLACDNRKLPSCNTGLHATTSRVTKYSYTSTPEDQASAMPTGESYYVSRSPTRHTNGHEVSKSGHAATYHQLPCSCMGVGAGPAGMAAAGPIFVRNS